MKARYHRAFLLLLTMLLFWLAACAPQSSGWDYTSIATPVSPGNNEVDIFSVLKSLRCDLPDNLKLYTADGPVYAPDSSGRKTQVRGMLTYMKSHEPSDRVELFSNHGMIVDHRQFVEQTGIHITEKEYYDIQYALTVLHESIHACTPDTAVDSPFLAQYLDPETNVFWLVMPTSRMDNLGTSLVLQEHDEDGGAIERRIIPFEEILTHGLTNLLVPKISSFKNPELAQRINIMWNPYTPSIRFFTNVIPEEDIIPLLEAKSARNTPEAFEIVFRRFDEVVARAAAARELKLAFSDHSDFLERKKHYFVQFLTLLSDVSKKDKVPGTRTIISDLMFNASSRTPEQLGGSSLSAEEDAAVNDVVDRLTHP